MILMNLNILSMIEKVIKNSINMKHQTPHVNVKKNLISTQNNHVDVNYQICVSLKMNLLMIPSITNLLMNLLTMKKKKLEEVRKMKEVGKAKEEEEGAEEEKEMQKDESNFNLVQLDIL